MKNSFLILFMGLCFMGYAQSRPSPYTAVERFFEAFHAKDSLALQALFHPEARLMRSGNRNGNPVVQKNDIQHFIRAVASRKATPVWEERLGKPQSQQHQNLATVWVPFHFYLDNSLSHCGYNAFTLVWDTKQWKILSLIDTGTKDCEGF